MSKILSINSGSSSLKYSLYEMPEEKVITSGMADRIGTQGIGKFTIKINGVKKATEVPLSTHNEAVKMLLDALIDNGIIKSYDEIEGVGHRIVQGGPYFSESVVVDDDVVAKVDEMCDLAPLHNPAHLVCYRAFKEVLPNVKHVFVFDTAFHQTMTRESYLFPVPMSWYRDYKVRRYGAHGTSHEYVAHECARKMHKDIKDLNIITLHLGNGASITAIKGGKCINTSMGLTPLGGICMGTRSGDLDPSVVLYMMKKLNKTPEEMDKILNRESGMLGLSEISSDSRDVEDAYVFGDDRARLCYEVYVNRIINVVGGYVMQLGHVDAIVFTAGLGERAPIIRREVLKILEEPLGLKIDYLKNACSYKGTKLSLPESKVAVYSIATDEELQIVRDTYRLTGK